MAGARDNDQVLTGISTTGQVKLNIVMGDIYNQPSKAELIVGKDTMNFANDCNAFMIIEPANHVFVMYFQQKGTNADSTNAKTLQLWAMPSGFELMPGASLSSKFRAKVLAIAPEKRGEERMEFKLNCTFIWSP